MFVKGPTWKAPAVLKQWCVRFVMPTVSWGEVAREQSKNNASWDLAMMITLAQASICLELFSSPMFGLEDINVKSIHLALVSSILSSNLTTHVETLWGFTDSLIDKSSQDWYWGFQFQDPDLDGQLSWTATRPHGHDFLLWQNVLHMKRPAWFLAMAACEELLRGLECVVARCLASDRVAITWL